MDQLLRNRTLNIIVILLLVVNIITVGLFWMRQTDHLPGGQNKRGEVIEFLVHELKMDSAQKNKLIALRAEHRSAMQSLRRNQEEAKDEFFSLVKNDQATEVEINSAMDKVTAADKAIDVLTLNHFKAIRKICSAQQQIRFDEIIQEAIHMMRPGGGPPQNRPVNPNGMEQGPPPPNMDQGPPPPHQ